MLDLCTPANDQQKEVWEFAVNTTLDPLQSKSLPSFENFGFLKTDIAHPTDIVSALYYAARYQEATEREQTRKRVLSNRQNDDDDEDELMPSPLTPMSPNSDGYRLPGQQSAPVSELIKQCQHDLDKWKCRLPPRDPIVFPSWPNFSDTDGKDYEGIVLRALLMRVIETMAEHPFNSDAAHVSKGRVPAQVIHQARRHFRCCSEETKSYIDRSALLRYTLEDTDKANLSHIKQFREHGFVRAHHVIFDSMPVLLHLLDRQPDLFHSTVLRQCVEIAMYGDYIRGLEAAKRILDCFDRMSDRSEDAEEAAAEIAHLSLFPTVYDDDATYLIASAQSPKTPMNETLEKQRSAIEAVGSFASIGDDETENDNEATHRRKSKIISFNVHRRHALDMVVRNLKVSLPMVKLEL
jgi:hypothetical protein